jgi:hypothetical protein
VTVASEQAQLHVEFRSAQPVAPSPPAPAEQGDTEKRHGFRFPSLLSRPSRPTLMPPLGKEAREERAEERQRQKQALSTEAAKAAFFETPAGRARLAYRRGHRLFQYELEINGIAPTVIPGPVGSPALETVDPVDILNSVTAEGWKLVTGKFIHSEMRNGAIGIYLFKRSQKYRLSMNDPWHAPEVVTPLGTLSV